MFLVWNSQIQNIHLVTLHSEWRSHLKEFLELLWLQALPSFSLTSQVRQILRETLPLQKQKNKKSSVYIQGKNSNSLKQVLFILRESQEIEFGFFSFAWMVLLFLFARKLYCSCFLLLAYILEFTFLRNTSATFSGSSLAATSSGSKWLQKTKDLV